ncbi:MAG TPA: electron transport complex subunit RsxB, partial [Gammaproteobacteria bacterium]
MQPKTDNSIVNQIDALLPQTQCRQCNYPGCRPYAEAIVSGEADINQCPPGGQATIHELAALLGREAKPLNPENGVETENRVAVIDENVCIGCVLCIQACPVDAILGAAKQMHTVIAAECTGCKLCIAPCPVDCISMVPAQEPVVKDAQYRKDRADAARRRFEARNLRLQRIQEEKAETIRKRRQNQQAGDKEARQAVIRAALARVKAKKQARGNT